MIILHDTPGGDLSHIQAMAEISEGFALFDYVQVRQANGLDWIGQIVQPNQNISTVGNRLDPTILHGLKLMQTHKDVQSVQSVQIFDILVLGQYDGTQMTTPRLRPLPGSVVTKLGAEVTSRVIGLPSQTKHANDTPNVIGELLNADSVPLCFDALKFNYHIMVAGGTGSGKSNVAANLVDQAALFGKCVLIHDAKPDYALIGAENTDMNVAALWTQFSRYGLTKHPAANMKRIGFYGKCDIAKVDAVVGFRASDFQPEMLASFFFTGTSSAEQNGFEAFARVADFFWQKKAEKAIAHEDYSYSLDDILREVTRRSNPRDQSVTQEEQIHEATGPSIQRKVGARRRGMPWLDAVGKNLGPQGGNGRTQSRLQSSSLDGVTQKQVEAFTLAKYVAGGRIVIIDYSQMDDQSYALVLSYFLRTCHQYRRKRDGIGIVQLVDEAHRIFDNDSRHSGTLARSFERVMREGRTLDHSIILSLQNASQVPPRVMNNLNSKIVMRQNSKVEAEAATQTMGKDFAVQSMRLGTGHALVGLFESRATVLAQMAPSPFELLRSDNTSVKVVSSTQASQSEEQQVAVDASDYE